MKQSGIKVIYMAIGMGKSEANGKKMTFWSSMIYYAVIIFLLVSIFFMYSNWNKRRQQYAQLVQEASVQDQGYAIEFQKNRTEKNATDSQSEEDVIKTIDDKSDNEK
jgi:cytoskeletal protein RodZ